MTKNNVKSVYNTDIEERVQQGESVKVQIVGRDMLPMFKEEDYVVVSPIKEKTKGHTSLKSGDVVLFHHKKEIKLHRVIHLNGTLLRIKGDHCYDRYEKVTCSDVIGIVTEGTYFGGIKFTANSFFYRLLAQFWVRSHFIRLHTVYFFRLIARKCKK